VPKAGVTISSNNRRKTLPLALTLILSHKGRGKKGIDICPSRKGRGRKENDKWKKD